MACCGASLLASLAAKPAEAACTTTGNTIICAPGTAHTARIGNGPNQASGTTVTVQPNAQVTAGNTSAISLGDNATITLGAGSTVTNNATSGSGLWSAGNNTIEFGSNGTLTIATGATVSALGAQNNGEPINVMGVGNVITNYGTVTSRSGAAIWFEDRTSNGTNTVDNYGVIQTLLGSNANVIGNQNNGSVTFINRTGARVEGSLSFASGSDHLTLEAGSVITGSFDGGGGTNTLTLGGAAGSSDSLAGDIRNFQTLTKSGAGKWTLTGAVGANGGNAALQVLVNEGTLALTGDNANFNGSITVESIGILEARAQSLPPTVTNDGLVRFTQDTAGDYTGIISGLGSVEKTLGGTLTLSGVNTYQGGTVINAGTVLIAADSGLGAASGGVTINGATLGVIADVTTARATTITSAGGALQAAAGTTLTHNGVVSGTGSLSKTGDGTVVLTNGNTYAGRTIIEAGVLQIGSDANLGASGSGILFSGGTLRVADTISTARATEIDGDGGTIEVNPNITFTNNSTITGAGSLTKAGDGLLILNGTNTYAGGTTVTGGVVQITSEANLGATGGALTLDGGTLRTGNNLTLSRAGIMGSNGGTFDTIAGRLVYDGIISGSGGLTKTGAGILTLTRANSYSGDTTVTAGELFVNGDQSAATGTTTIASGAHIAGSGTIGGDVIVADGAYLHPGSVDLTPATLTINGSLTLNAGSTLFYNMVDTEVGGALNDLTVVKGDLVLDGTINILDQGQTLGPGVYRVIDYDGSLTDNGLNIGVITPSLTATGSPLTGFSVQTAVAGQVNLVNTTGLTLTYWDGDVGPKNDGAINGGDGTWRRTGSASTSNWTEATGAVNAPWADDGFAIFTGAAGTVAVSNDSGQVTAAGMQFATDGYLLQGDPLELVGGTSVIRVGDGSRPLPGAEMVATISSVLTGSSTIRKLDTGTLILTGVNTYTGGTRIDGGAIQIAADTALGAASGDLTLNAGELHTTADIVTSRAIHLGVGGGEFRTDVGTGLTAANIIDGGGSLTKLGDGFLVLTGANTYSGGTTITAGTVQIGDGGTTGSIVGDVANSGALVFNRSDQITYGGVVSGTGSLTQAGPGTTILNGTNTYTGGTTITQGALQIGAGGTAGSIVGDVTNNGALIFNRSDLITFGGLVSGTGSLVQTGTGSTFLTAANSYTGATTISAGKLFVNGDQSAATGLTTVASGAQLSGSGTIGGDVIIADGGILHPGAENLKPAILTINGDLTLNDGSILLYNMINTEVGGPLNDLTIVRGDLTLDGTINIVDQGQTLGPGVYRVFNYDGALTDNGLNIGVMTPDLSQPGMPLTGFSVQTAIANQVNLINTTGLNLNYWDGDVGPKNDSEIDGGDGTWRNGGPSATSNWTDANGAVNAPWSDAEFAIFAGTAGTVTVNSDNGQVVTSGMQFATNGYLIQGDPLELSGGVSTIRVGDGTSASAGMTATISSILTGASSVRKTDGGTLVLTSANTYTGGTEIDGGVIQIAADTALGDASGALTFNNGELHTTADITTARAIDLESGGGKLRTDTGTTYTASSAIEGVGALTKLGAGTLLLTADNTYSGGTIISAGTVRVGNGGTTGSLIGDVANSGALVFERSNTATYGGSVSGTGTLAQAGTGTTILTGTNTYTGGTTISAGVLQLGAGGTTGSVMGDITNNAALVVDRSDAMTYGGVISGSGAFTQAGTGTTILTGTNVYTGATTIAQGTLQLGAGGTTGSVLGDILNNGVLIVNRSDDIAYGGVVSGSGSAIKSGAGALILTGENTYTGGTTIAQGTLQIGDGGATGSIVGDILNNGVLVVDRSDDILYAGVVSGAGSVVKESAGTLVVTGTNTYTGGTTIAQGTLMIGFGGTSGSVLGDIVDNGALVFNRSDNLLINGLISGTGTLEQAGVGRTVLSANNTYTGGTTISAGALQIGNGGTTGNILGDVVNDGELIFNRSDVYTFSGLVSGSGELVQAGLGTLVLTASNTYTGGTAVEEGTLQISQDANLGASTGPLRLSRGTLSTTADITTSRITTLATNGGTFDTLAGTTLTHTGEINGAGGLTKAGLGTLVLSGANHYAGQTNVASGTLIVNGDQTGAINATTVATAATLGGSGVIGGDVTIADGATLAPGFNGPGTLTINGDLSLSSGSLLQYEFGQANTVGGPLNDLTQVAGDLVLDGTINVTTSAGGSFDPGIYRVISYGGALSNNGLTVGTIPASGYYVQTSVANQVNLINTTGLTLNYWDGAAGVRNDGVITGGDGLWQNSTGNDNWTTMTGALNAPFDDGAFAIFVGSAGTVTIDRSLGAVTASGMQFATNGYVVEGGALDLVGAVATVRVGDGSSASVSMTATINSVLTGTSTLRKTDGGTLVLNEANTYTGGTSIEGGVLQISADANLGATASTLSINGGTLRTTTTLNTARAILLGALGGTLETATGTTLTASGVADGVGALTKTGAGTLVLTGANTYSGGTTIAQGTLRIGDGGTTGSILGDIVDNGALVFNRSDTLLISGAISGAGTLEQAGAGRTILSANNTYTGGTTISAGALQIGAGGTTGSISGDVVNNGDLIFNRSDAYTFGGVVSGSGDLFQSGLGTLVLTGANQYAGTTTVASGTLIVNGNQSAATGATSVAAAATLGGTGVIGGDVTIASGATLSPGFNGPGTLTINGDLSLSSGSLLQYQFGQADTVGGPLNDLTVVAGDLVLDGTINVTTSVGGSFDAGIYRVISYAGALTNNGLTVGTIPADSYYVQTSIANEVNLINTTGLTLNYWDGGTGLRGDGLITGGDGVWQNSTGNENWTTATGSINAPFTNGAFAIFAGSAGTVNIDRSLGAVSASGMQFATNGYAIQGGALDLTGDVATVRVGDGSSASARMTATINSVLTGTSTLRKSDAGTLVLNAANTYAGGTSVEGGVLQVSADANLGAAGGAVSINGATLRTTATLSTARTLQLGALGGTLETATGTTLIASGVADGAGALTKTGAGALVLSGTNTYAGGTTVTQGTLQIAQNANLGATAGGLTLNGGALQTTANVTSGRALAVTADSGVITNDATTLTWTGALTGAGVFTKTGGGTMVFNGDGAAFTGGAIVGAGTLAVDSVFTGTVNVLSGGRLEGNGRTGNISNAGVVAPGRSIGTLTVGNYVGAGGTLEIEAVLGDDTSSTDRLVVTGATSGNTLVSVINVGGLGAQTIEGIKIIDVAGASNGQFTLNADYLFEGDPTVIAGAYGYRLYKNGVSTPTDGDWYLRSTLTEEEPEPPLYQPGVPIYEAYPQALLALNTLPTMQQRVGNRAWSDGVTVEEGVWGRVEGFAFRPDAVVSTASVDLSVDRWQMQFGLDKILSEQDDGSRLVGGITAHYGNGDTSVRSVYGDGSIDTEHYGVGATLTWFGTRGVYVDGQANFNWFDSDLNSKTLGRLFTGNNGTGQAYSFEIGMRTAIKGKLSLTPQFQMVYSTVDFDTFADPSDAVVSASKGDSLKTRWGVSLDYRDEEGPTERTHLYGLADLSYEWRGGAQVDVSGTPLAHRDGRLWLNVGAGGTRSWDNGRKAVFGEVQATTATRDFGSSYGFKGVLGFRVDF